MMANPEALPKIDWAYYKKVIVTPGLVDKFRKEYESLSVPYPADNYTAEIEAAKSETVIIYFCLFYILYSKLNFINSVKHVTG